MSSDERIRFHRSCNTLPSSYRRRDFSDDRAARIATGTKVRVGDGSDFSVNGRRRRRVVARMVFLVFPIRTSFANGSADKYKSPAHLTLDCFRGGLMPAAFSDFG